MTDNTALAFAIVMTAAVLAAHAYVTGASGHEAPSGINYPSGCCHSAALHAYGDCAPISGRYVSAQPDGYHVDLPKGAHPRLITKGYSGVIPYSEVRQPLDHEFHICLAQDGFHRYCFFPAPGSS
jgi:hypothetical protein